MKRSTVWNIPGFGEHVTRADHDNELRLVKEQRDGYAMDLEVIRTALQARGYKPTLKVNVAVLGYIGALEARLKGDT